MGRLFNRAMLLALLLAVAGGGATYAALSGSGGAPAPAKTGQVLVAARDLPVGVALTEADLRLKSMPASGIPATALRRVEDATGKYAAFPLVAGETVLAAKVSADAPGGSLAALIPPGHVAVSIAVSDVISTGGFIAPGDRVDVLGVVSKDASDRADLVLTDVPVLAVSQAVIGGGAEEQRDRSSGVRQSPTSLDTTVTLVVTVDEAQRLVQVDEVGKLRLALRPRATTDGLLRRQ
jgi:pilus assembly protein CpaB